MTYLLPCAAPVSASWQAHKDRDPPSAEPGTDYACAFRTPLVAAGAGIVADLSHSTTGGTGRYLAIDLEDGRRVRYLHLDEIWVDIGQRLGAGQVFGLSGASGHGSDWGYGAHVHVTLFPWHAYDFDLTLDFQLYVTPPAPPIEEDLMSYAIVPDAWTADIYVVSLVTGNRARVGSPDHVALLERARDNDGSDPMAWPELDTVRSYLLTINPPHPTGPPAADPARTSPLTGPAWLVGAVLSLIGLVELLRLVFDVL